MTDKSLTFKLFGVDVTASRALKGVGDEAEKTGRKVESSASRMGKALGGIGAGLAGAGVGAAVGALAGLGAALTQGVKDAVAYQTLQNKTAAVLASTGNAAGQTVQQVDDLAASLETLTGVDETLIINSENVLATFTNIRGQVFVDATKAALDLSVAMGSDLQSATVQVGKALNDPVKGLTALQKVGVSFSDQQRKQIENFVRTGQVAKAQGVILAELSKEFGNVAAAAGAGDAGELARIQDTFSDMARSFGAELLPYLRQFGEYLKNDVAPAVQGFLDDLRPWLPLIAQIVTALWNIQAAVYGVFADLAKPVLQAFATVVSQIGGLLSDLFNMAADAADRFGLPWASQLRSTARMFSEFRDNANMALAGITDRVVTVSVQMIQGGQVVSQQADANRANAREGRGASAADLKAVAARQIKAQPFSVTQPKAASSGAKKVDPRVQALKDVQSELATLTTSLLASRAQAGRAFAALAGDVSKAGSTAGRAIVNANAKVLLALAQTYETVGNRISTAQSNLKNLQDEQASFVESTRSQIVALGDITKTFNAQVIEDGKVVTKTMGYSFGAMRMNLQQQIAYARAFATALAQLKAKGLDSTSVAQLVAAGPQEGLKQASILLGAGDAGIRQIAQLQKDLAAAGGQVGTTAGHAMYDAGIQAAQGLVKGLQSQEKALEAQMTRLGNTLAAALKKTLKIKSPSQVFHEIGGYVGEGLIRGLDEQQAAATASAGRLVGAVSAGQAVARAGGGGATVTEIHNHFPPGFMVGTQQQFARMVREASGSSRATGLGLGAA